VLNYYNSQSCPIESVDLNGLAVEEAYTAVVEKLTQLVTLTGHVL
jgi:hypothetical protein